MKQSEQARREAMVDQQKKERELVQGVRQDGHWPDGQHPPVKDQGFDRAHQGAPRAEDRSSYKGQSAYGSLEANDRGGVPLSQEPDTDDKGGGVSRYGNNLGSRYALDQEPGSSQRTASAPLSRAGFAPGAAAQSTDVGQYAGEYDDTPPKGGALPGESGAEPGARFGRARGTRSEPDRGAAHPHGPAGSSHELRGDQQLKEEIRERLNQRPDLDIHDLSVAMREGHVTLEGSVPDAHMKEVIMQLVDNVSGVRKIDDRITVQHVNPAGHATAQAYAVGAQVTEDLQHSGPQTFGAASAKASALKQQQAEKPAQAAGGDKDSKS